MPPTPPSVSAAVSDEPAAIRPGGDLLTVSRPRAVVLAALLMIAAQLGFRAWAVLGSWYRYDDANFMARLLADGLSPHLMFHGFAGHLMPLSFAVTAFNFSRDPYAWAYPGTELLVLQALADVGALVLLISAFGRRPGILPPLALFLFSALAVPASVSWAPGITQLPFVAAVFWGGWANLHYLRTRKVVWALATMAITVVAIGFGEKAVLLFWTYAVVAVCWFAEGDPVSRVKTIVRRYLVGVILYSIVAVGAVVAYLTLAAGSSGAAGQPVKAQTFADVAERLLFDSWAPALLGGPLRWRWRDDVSTGLAEPGIVVSVASVLIIAALTWEIARTRQHAMRAWWLIGGVLAADVVMITTARAVMVGSEPADAFRYLTETGAVTALALALATLPLIGAVETVAAAPTASPFLAAPRRVAAATAVVAVLGVFSSIGYVQTWHDDTRTRHYVDTVRSDLAAAPTRPVPMADGPVPQWMIWSLAAPDNRVSRALRPLSGRMSFPRFSTNNLYTVDDHGHVRPAVVQPVRHATPVAGATKACPHPVRSGAARIGLDGPVVGASWWMRISYRATAAGTMHVVAGSVSFDTGVQPGFRSLYVRTATGRFQQVSLSGVSVGSLTCVDEIEVGHVAPFGPPVSAGSTS